MPLGGMLNGIFGVGNESNGSNSLAAQNGRSLSSQAQASQQAIDQFSIDTYQRVIMSEAEYNNISYNPYGSSSYRFRTPTESFMDSLNYINAEYIKEIIIKETLFKQILAENPSLFTNGKKDFTIATNTGTFKIINEKYHLNLDEYLIDIQKQKLP